MTPLQAGFAFATALVAALVLTPVAARFASRVGAIDEPRERGLSQRATPRLGGLAIFAAVALSSALWLDSGAGTRGIIAGAATITLIGALDDIVGLPAPMKLAGQTIAALIAVLSGVTVNHITFPFLGPTDFGAGGGLLTMLGLVAIMNAVNLSDGVDGLAAGICAISALAFSVIAFDLQRNTAAVLAALVARAAVGFLVHNFHPASVFMGDCGSNLLGFLLGCVAIQGTLKTNALIALALPLVILAVPFLDTGFVIAKRLKYRRPIHHADDWHLHHRFANIGFSQQRTVLYLYAWTLAMSGLALALRFVPYSDHHGHYHTGWTIVMLALGAATLAASLYLIIVLEILKLRRLRDRHLRRGRSDTPEEEIDAAAADELDTGQFDAPPR